jgi:hypothetical protein
VVHILTCYSWQLFQVTKWRVKKGMLAHSINYYWNLTLICPHMLADAPGLCILDLCGALILHSIRNFTYFWAGSMQYQVQIINQLQNCRLRTDSANSWNFMQTILKSWKDRDSSGCSWIRCFRTWVFLRVKNQFNCRFMSWWFNC